MQSEPKKRQQHYVWKYHLRAWSDQGAVWCRMGDRCFPVSVERIAKQREFYGSSGDSIPISPNDSSVYCPRNFDDPEQPPVFIVDAAGKTESRETLVDGESRWLWFKPAVMREILSGRSAHIEWYTAATGSIGMIPGRSVHFGVNDLGLINVYAKDIALLTNWEQRRWAGFNVGPEGKVSKELLDSQMRAVPANTEAPERYLGAAYDAVNQEFSRVTGRRLFAEHQAIDDLMFRAHRFRALDRQGLFELAKDLARLTVESIDGTGLNTIANPPEDANSGSIKHLAEVLAMVVGEENARRMTGVFVGINELRQADAHLPSSDLDLSISLAGVAETGISVREAQQMLHRLVDSLYEIKAALGEL